MIEPHADMNVRHGTASRIKDYLWGAGLILLVGIGLWTYVMYCLNEMHGKMKLEELKNRSPAHLQILNSYNRCMGPRSPGHMACIGSVAKAAELYGYKPKQINRVLEDAGLLADPGSINSASRAHH